MNGTVFFVRHRRPLTCVLTIQRYGTSVASHAHQRIGKGVPRPARQREVSRETSAELWSQQSVLRDLEVRRAGPGTLPLNVYLVGGRANLLTSAESLWGRSYSMLPAGQGSCAIASAHLGLTAAWPCPSTPALLCW